MTADFVKPFRTGWVIPALSCLVALATGAAGAVLFLASLFATLVTRDMAAVVAGLLGGSLLGSCGGIALVWSLGRMGKGV